MRDYLARSGAPKRRWDYPEPNDSLPEAEWGFDEALAKDAERFAASRGHRVVALRFEEPEGLSPAVAELYRWWYRHLGVTSNRLFVESFMLLDPMLVLRSGRVPFWTKFSVETGIEALERYLRDANRFEEIAVTLFPHGVDSIGMAPPGRWRNALSRLGYEAVFSGVDETRFPRDFSAFARFHEALLPEIGDVPAPLPVADALHFLEEAAPSWGIDYVSLDS